MTTESTASPETLARLADIEREVERLIALVESYRLARDEAARNAKVSA